MRDSNLKKFYLGNPNLWLKHFVILYPQSCPSHGKYGDTKHPLVISDFRAHICKMRPCVHYLCSCWVEVGSARPEINSQHACGKIIKDNFWQRPHSTDSVVYPRLCLAEAHLQNNTCPAILLDKFPCVCLTSASPCLQGKYVALSAIGPICLEVHINLLILQRWQKFIT